GDLATLVMLETRLTARSPEVVWDDMPLPPDADPADPVNQEAYKTFYRTVVAAPDRRLMGAEQLAFVGAALSASVEAGKPWQVIGSQVLMGRIISPNYVATLPDWLKLVIRTQFPEAYTSLQRSQFNIPLNLDQWDGYPAERERFYEAAQTAGAQLLT